MLTKNQTKNSLKNPRKTIKTKLKNRLKNLKIQRGKTKNESSKKPKTNLKIETNPTKTIKKIAKTHLKTSPQISKISTYNQSKSTLNIS